MSQTMEPRRRTGAECSRESEWGLIRYSICGVSRLKRCVLGCKYDMSMEVPFYIVVVVYRVGKERSGRLVLGFHYGGLKITCLLRSRIEEPA